MIYGSVCSGIEAATVAWHGLGWRPAWFAEIDPFASRVLHHHYGCGRPVSMPDPALAKTMKDRKLRAAAIKAVSGIAEGAPGGLRNAGDFTTIQPGHYAAIDLLVGGTPCQSFSIAGLRGGLDDDRGNLALEFLRLADRFRPRWLVWENVPGVLSSGGGRDFGSILRGLVELGYGFVYRVLDAQYFGLAQRRKRVFVVAYLGDWRPAAAVLFERDFLSGHPAPRRQAGAQSPVGTLGGTSPGGGWRLGPDEAAAGQLIAGTLRGHPRPGSNSLGATVATQAFGGNNSRGHIDGATAVVAHGGPHGRQDFESETFIAVTPVAEAGKRTGRSSTDKKAGDGLGAEGDPMFALGADSRHAVAYKVTGNSGAWSTGDKADTLTTGSDPSANLIAFDTTQITSATNFSNPRPGDPCHPLAAGQHPPAIAFSCKDHGADASDDVAPTLRAMNHSGSHANAGGQVAVCVTGDVAHTLRAEGFDTSEDGTGRGQPMTASAAGVRRLTVVECERLQGFPDGYTMIPIVNVRPDGRVIKRWRRIAPDEAAYLAGHGAEVEYHEAHGRWYTTAAADGPRYKALGNSMATTVMQWIGERINAVDHIVMDRKIA